MAIKTVGVLGCGLMGAGIAQVSAAAALHSLPSDLLAVAVQAGDESALPSVAVDQIAGAELAVRHLLELGHETVWHIAGPTDWLEARDRIEGWRRTLVAAGAEVVGTDIAAGVERIQGALAGVQASTG